MSRVCFFQEFLYHNEKTGEGIAKMTGDDHVSFLAYGTFPTLLKNVPLRLGGGFEEKNGYGTVFRVREKNFDFSSSFFNQIFLCELLKNKISEGTLRYLIAHIPEIYAEKKERASFLEDFPKQTAEGKTLRSLFLYLDNATTVMGWQDEFGEIPLPFCEKLVKRYGTDKADEKLGVDIYSLGLNYDLGFLQCDKIAHKRGVGFASIQRIHGAWMHTAKSFETSGNTFASLETFLPRLNSMLSHGAYPFEFSPSFLFSMKPNALPLEKFQGNYIVCFPKLKMAEMGIARNIKRLCVNKKTNFKPIYIKEAEEKFHVHYSEEQRDTICGVSSECGVSLITGGPGRGKTQIIHAICYAEEQMKNEPSIVLCAPTGKSARRMQEATGRLASTIHHCLELNPMISENAKRNEDNPIEADLLIVDELSMVGVPLMAQLLAAIKTGTNVVLVGDPDQLSSVEPGSVLSDMLSTNKLKKFHLTKNFRQTLGSKIALNADKINANDVGLEKGGDFQYASAMGEDQVVDWTMKMVERFGKDLQILCSTKKTEAGTIALNRQIQAKVNPPSPSKAEIAYGNLVFREGDKVLFIHNCPDLDYWNGDVGTLLKIRKQEMLIQTDLKIIQVPKENYGDLDLAYCMTIHKAQGSEYKNVLIILPAKIKNMLLKNLIYTAVTRGKEHVYIISQKMGSMDSLQYSILHTPLHRKTRLSSLLQ